MNSDFNTKAPVPKHGRFCDIGSIFFKYDNAAFVGVVVVYGFLSALPMEQYFEYNGEIPAAAEDHG